MAYPPHLLLSFGGSVLNAGQVVEEFSNTIRLVVLSGANGMEICLTLR